MSLDPRSCKGTALCFLVVTLLSGTLTNGQERWTPINLPSGKVLLDAPAGTFVSDMNALPINSSRSPDGRYLAFLNNGYGAASSGYRKSIALYDRVTDRVADFTEPGTGLHFDGPADISTTYYGIAFSSNGRRLYVSIASTKKDPRLGDRTQNGIRIYRVREHRIDPDGVIPIPPAEINFPLGVTLNNPAPTPSGISVRPDPDNPNEDLIYAALTLGDAAVELSTRTKRIRRVFNLHNRRVHPSLPAEYPYDCAAAPDGKTLYVSLYNGSAIAVVDLASGQVAHLPVGAQIPGASMPSSHPTHLVFTPSGKALLVAIENSDQISIIDNDPASKTYRRLTGTFDVRPEEMVSRKLLGASPNHLAFTPDGRTLLVTCSLLNAVAVLDVTGEAADLQLKVRGYLPTLWYPRTLEVSLDGKNLFITSGKGKGTGPNRPSRPFAPGPRPGAYIATLLQGSLHRMTMDQVKTDLARFTQSVKKNNQLDAASLADARKALDFNPIKHVIYVIKENRTFDQILGDLEKGRTDKTCLYFGEKYTPNQHRLARQFGIYDNFFVSAEVSFNGHTWSTAGINSGWNEQQWQINYSTQNFTYDSEGRNNQIMPIEHGQSDVDTPQGGYVWDTVIAGGKNIGIYGEYCDNPKTPLKVLRKGDPYPSFLSHPKLGPVSKFGWVVPLFADLDPEGKVIGGTVATKEAFKNAYQPLFPDYQLLHPDVLRYLVWKRDFDRIADTYQETGKDTLPALSIVRLGTNHTRGVAPGGPTPDASVADNDLALGMLVESISGNEYYWSNTAIVVLEDDAQAGCDHIDAHRSPMFFISRYNTGSAAQPRVDSRFLTTASAIRTIEALLGLSSNNLMTATAPLLFTSLNRNAAAYQRPYQADYTNLENGQIFEEASGVIRTNPILQELAKLTSTLEMEDADEADANTLNYILEKWVEFKGRLNCCGGK